VGGAVVGVLGVGGLIAAVKFFTTAAAKQASDHVIVQGVQAAGKAATKTAEAGSAAAAAKEYANVSNKTVEKSIEFANMNTMDEHLQDFKGQEQYDPLKEIQAEKEPQISTPDDHIEVRDDKDNRKLVEKLMEPGQKEYGVVYDSVQRLNNPEIKKTLKLRRAEEMQMKLDEMNEKDIQTRQKKPKKGQPK